MRTERRTRVDYGRWLRERDTKELVDAICSLSYELALIKCDDRTSVVDDGRLRERDTEELVYAVGRLSYELTMIKRHDRTSVSFQGSSQDWSSRGTDCDKRDPKKSHHREDE
jgi:hypothetical protein